MESLMGLIKTYIYNLSIFYCQEPEINDEELDTKLNDLDTYIIHMFVK